MVSKDSDFTEPIILAERHCDEVGPRSIWKIQGADMTYIKPWNQRKLFLVPG